GGWHWLLAPLILFVTYNMFSSRIEKSPHPGHNVHAVVAVASSGFLWLFLYRIFDRPDFLYPYTVAFAAHLAMIVAVRLCSAFAAMPLVTLLAISCTVGWLLLLGPYVLAEGPTTTTLVAALIALPAVSLVTVVFCLTQPSFNDCPVDTLRWLPQ